MFVKGEIYKYCFKNEHTNHCLIVSNGLAKNNRNVLALPISDREDTINDCIGCMIYDKIYYILCEKIYTIDSKKLNSPVCTLENIIMKSVDDRISEYLNIQHDVIIDDKTTDDVKVLENSLSRLSDDINSLRNEIRSYNDKLCLGFKTLSELFANPVKEQIIDNPISVKTLESNDNESNNANVVIYDYLNDNNKSDDISNDHDNDLDHKLKKYEISHREVDITHDRGKGKKRSLYLDRFDYNIENALAFIDEWNNNSIETLCKKYSCTRKQICNRKYNVCKYLIYNNIDFDVAERRGVRSCQK